MLITIPDVLTVGEVAQARTALDAAEWVDGKVTAGYQAQKVKDNLQLPEGHPVTVKLGEMVLAALARSPLFMSAALPLRVFPPMFNRYTGGGYERMFRRRCFFRLRRSMTGASCRWKIRMACTA
jgi:PKHD-type hydroxylase